MTIDAQILILSDLHFSRDLYEPPQQAILSLRGLPKKFFSERIVTSFLTRKCKGHDIAAITELPYYLNVLLTRAGRKAFDLCILLGDQVTVPDSGAYAFLRSFLTLDEYRCKEGNIEYRCRALGLSDEQIVAIPGNHDKLLLTDLDLYNEHFTRRLGLREELSRQTCAVCVRQIAGREFVFVLVDVNRYAPVPLSLDWSARKHLASGEITTALREEIFRKLNALKEGRDSDRCESFDTAYKMLLVHFAVETNRFRSNLWDRGLPHMCEGLPKLVDDLREAFGLHIVLHGHLHQPKIYPRNGVQVISATTSAQSGGKVGFFIINVDDLGRIFAEHHSWNGAAFAADPSSASLSRVIMEAPVRLAA